MSMIQEKDNLIRLRDELTQQRREFGVLNVFDCNFAQRYSQRRELISAISQVDDQLFAVSVAAMNLDGSQ